jgi:hypothetical protein
MNPTMLASMYAWGMNHSIGFFLFENLAKSLTIGDINAVVVETRFIVQAVESGLLQGDVVIVIEVVDANHGVTAAHQSFTDEVTDESGCAGDHDFH